MRNLGTKNTYMILNINTGAIQDIKINPPLKEPQIAVFNESQVILLSKGNKVSSYNLASDKNTYFCDDISGEGVRLQIHNLNLIIMSDKEMRVYNPDKLKLLQNFGSPTDLSARYTALG